MAIFAAKRASIHRTNFTNSYSNGTYSIAVYSTVVGLLDVQSVCIKNNTAIASGIGGSLFTFYVTHINVSQITVWNNSATGYNAVAGVRFESADTAQLLESSFSENSCHGVMCVGALFAGHTGHLDVESTNFSLNSGYGGGVAAMSVTVADNVRIVNCSFTANTGEGVSGAMLLDRSLNTFISQVFYLSGSLRGNKAQSGLAYGGAISVGSASELIITATVFADNTAAAAGAIYGQAESSLLIEPPFFDEVCGCIGEAYGFNYNWSPFAYAAENHYGKFGFYADELPQVQGNESLMDMDHYRPRHGTIFINNTAFSGGAMMAHLLYNGPLAPHTVTSSRLFICVVKVGQQQPCSCPNQFGTSFENNTAFSGGAISSINNNLGLVLMNVSIINNRAVGKFEADVEYMVAVTSISRVHIEKVVSSNGCSIGGGGGLCISCGNAGKVEGRACWGYVAASTLESNTAQFGGGLYATAGGGGVLGDTELDNSYTIDITGVHPYFVRIMKTRISTSMWNEYEALYVKYYGLAPSGMQDENSTHATIFRGNTAVGGAGGAIYMEQLGVVNISCDSGSTQMIMISTSQGEMVVEQTFSFFSSPGPRSVTISKFSSELNRAYEPTTINFYVRPCKLGEFNPDWIGGYQCLLCDAGFFNVDTYDDSSKCQECPKEATCVTDTTTQPNADNAIIVPDDGLFNSNPFSVQLYECTRDSCTYDGRHDRIVEYQIAISRDPSFPLPHGSLSESSTPHVSVVLDPPSWAALTGERGSLSRTGPSSIFWSFLSRAGSSSFSRRSYVDSQQLGSPITSGVLDGAPFTAPSAFGGAPPPSSSPLGGAPSPSRSTLGGSPSPSPSALGGAPSIPPSEFGVAPSIPPYALGGALSISPFTLGRAPSTPPSARPPPSATTPQLKSRQKPSVLQNSKSENGALAGCVYSCPGQQDEDTPSMLRLPSSRICHTIRENGAEARLSRSTSINKLPLKRCSSSLSRRSKSPSRNLQMPFQTRQEIQLEAGFIVLSATWKVLVTYLQTLFMMSWIGRSNNILPAELFAIMETLQAFFASAYNWLPLECALQGSYSVDKRILVMIITIFFPWMAAYLISKLRNHDPKGSRSVKPFSWTDYGSRMILSLIIVIFFYYPTWVQAYLAIFLCYTVNLDAEGSDTKRAIEAGLHTGARWVSNFNLQCYQGEHAVLAFSVGIAGLLFIVVTPIHFAWRLYANSHRLDEHLFRARCYAWESYVMLRKLVFAASLMYLSSPFAPPGSQTLTALAIAGIALAAQLIFLPHASDYVHKMEILAHMSIIISLFLCNKHTTSQTPDSHPALASLGARGAGLDAQEVLEMPKHTVINLMLPVYQAKYKFLGKPLAVLFVTLSRLQWKVKHMLNITQSGLHGATGFTLNATRADVDRTYDYAKSYSRHPQATDAIQHVTCGSALDIRPRCSESDGHLGPEPVPSRPSVSEYSLCQLGIPDYFTIIKEPVDLNAIVAGIDSGAYSHFSQVYHHVLLVFTNAMCYNPPENPIHQLALEVRASFASRAMISMHQLQVLLEFTTFCFLMRYSWHGNLAPSQRVCEELSGKSNEVDKLKLKQSEDLERFIRLEQHLQEMTDLNRQQLQSKDEQIAELHKEILNQRIN
eukprot:gene69-12889_t